MSIIDSCKISLPSSEKTVQAGHSLARTLYTFPVTILMRGELGAGKTTFLQGFARGLGIEREVTSPTFALEQRYDTTHGMFIHIDLYRLSPSQAREYVATCEDGAIRAIEWPDRLELPLERIFPNGISISLTETPRGRDLDVECADIPLPSANAVEEWRRELMLPPALIAHCDAVSSFAGVIADNLIERGIIVRKETLMLAGAVHDLLRFIDFRANTYPENVVSKEQQTCWNSWKETYRGLRHEEACAHFLEERGFDALGRIVSTHGLALPSPHRTTIEQKLLFYADKRVAGDRVVTLDERFEDFRKRYGEGTDSQQSAVWYAEAKALERELFPSVIP